MTFEQLLLLIAFLLLPLINMILRRLSRQSEAERPRDAGREARDRPARRRTVAPSPLSESPRSRERGRLVQPQISAPQQPLHRAAGLRLRNLREARRGIVLMTILGRCRGMEPPAAGRQG